MLMIHIFLGEHLIANDPHIFGNASQYPSEN